MSAIDIRFLMGKSFWDAVEKILRFRVFANFDGNLQKSRFEHRLHSGWNKNDFCGRFATIINIIEGM